MEKNMNTTQNYEEIKKSFHEHLQWCKTHTAQFAKDLNIKTINDGILFSNDIINIVDTFYLLNDKKLDKLSEEEEFTIFVYNNERLMDKEEVLDFLSKDLLKIVYEEATVSGSVNKFEQASIKENLNVIFEEYMNVNAYTIPYLKPHLKQNINKKLTEKIDYTEDYNIVIKNKSGNKLFK